MDNKTEIIKFRATPEEKQKIKRLAKDKGYGTLSAYLLSSATNHVNVEVDTSDYHHLVIQVKRIGTNINQLIRNINFSGYFNEEQLYQIEIYLKRLDKYLEKENKKVNDVEKYMENISSNDLKKILQENKKEIPDYLIFDSIIDEINSKLLSFIDLLEKKNLSRLFGNFIYTTIEKIIPENFSYEELVNYSNDLDKPLYKINQKMLNPNNEFTNEDFETVRQVLLKYLI